MDLTSAVALRATTSLVKRLVDDVYSYGKGKISYRWDEWRSSLRERTIARSISKITYVKTLWNIEKEVSLYDFYYPSQINFSAGIVKKVDSLKELGRSSNFVIQGTAGQGKSIFLRYLCGQELRDGYSTNRIPLFVELRRLKHSLTLIDLIIESLIKYGIRSDADLFDACADSGKFVLLLDAFDEIDPAICQDVLSQIEYVAEKYQDGLQIIITSRPNADIQYSSRFRVCKLVPLKPSDHVPFLKKLCTEKGHAEDLAKVISSSPADVKSLLTTPLMLTLLVILYKAMQTVPDTVPRFYEELFDVLFYRHDHSKPGFRRKRHTNLDDSTVRNLFSAFCFYARLKSYGVITTAQFEECCNLAANAIGVQVDPKKFKDEIVKTVCLMQEEGFELSFIHKSVAEYYAASFVKDSSDNFAEKFYAYALGAYRFEEWALEIKFLSQIDKYRHAKYYVLRALAELQREQSVIIGETITPAHMDALENYFSRISGVRFIDASDGRYEPHGWERNCLNNPLLDESSNIWIATLAECNGSFSIPRKCLELVPDRGNLDTGKQIYSVKAKYCLALFPADVKQSAADAVKHFLVRSWQEATQVVVREEAKAHMIEQLLSPT